MRFIYKNWFWIALGTVLTKHAVIYAYHERGYMAYGGEWLVLPAILMAVTLVREIAETAASREEDMYAGKAERNRKRVPGGRRGRVG